MAHFTHAAVRGSAVRAWLVAVASALVGLGCGGDAGHEAEVVDAAVDDGRPAAPRVKPRTVTIELEPAATRTLEEGADGAIVYGPIEHLDGARTCVAHRRAAFASFEPFEPLEDPLCVTTAAGQRPTIEGVPAQSDLLITVEREGFVPRVLTHRVEDLDLPLPWWAGQLVTLLLPHGAADPWVETPAALDSGQAARASIIVEPLMVWTGATGAEGLASQHSSLDGRVPAWAQAHGVHLAAALAEDGVSALADLEVPTGRPLFLDVPAGTYRLLATHPRAYFEPAGAREPLQVAGLGTAAYGELEVPALAGHGTAAAPIFYCLPPAPEDRLADHPSCTFETGAP